MTKPVRRKPRSPDLWRRPMDLTPDLSERLLRGLAENHRHRLELMARKGGRVSMIELLGVTNDRDLRVLSYFQGALSRKVRRLVGDPEKRLHLIGWDYDATEWDPDHGTIVNGVCYLSEETTRVLQDSLGILPEDEIAEADLERKSW